ncbi:MAG: polymer-forming cytoskeletal protein [Ferruginibacter sp.]|nr:polymer-forming cytoskeletal protein [Ferruginibacter sp.]
MFNSKSKNSFDDSPTGGTTIIGAGTAITGNIDSNSDVRIDGKILGNVKAKGKILIGPDGNVEGDVAGEQIDILGKITGVINANDLLQLRGKAIINGDVYAGKLQVEPTVTFNGKCHMGANVVELNAEKAIAVNQ